MDALQRRANGLTRARKTEITCVVEESGAGVNIYTDGVPFMTVTPADAEANYTTPEKLASAWAERLRQLYPKVMADKWDVRAGGDPRPYM